VARCLIVGCGCRGRLLAERLRVAGHVVRGTTRRPSALPAIEAVGADGVLADPDRVASLVPALPAVSVACVLLGSADGPPAALAAMHGPRLEMLLSRMLDSTVHGLVYEAAGTVDAAVLESGAALVTAACTHSMIPFELLRADPTDYSSWADTALACVQRITR
jgi:uncharacterized protein YbjT (DUF2867 family)